MKDKKSKFILFIISIFIIGTFLVLLNKTKTAQYQFKTVNLTLSYPKKSTKIEIVKDEREIVDERVKFEISDKKFEEDLVVEVIIAEDSFEECIKVDANSPLLKSGRAYYVDYDTSMEDENSASKDSAQKKYKICGMVEFLDDCEITEKVSSYCPYYKEGYIKKGEGDSITQRFGPVTAYGSRTDHWEKAPKDFKGKWPEWKTRKRYTLFIASKHLSKSMDGRRVRIFAWFKTGDKEAEEAANRIARSQIGVAR